jgi:hypothetical protein
MDALLNGNAGWMMTEKADAAEHVEAHSASNTETLLGKARSLDDTVELDQGREQIRHQG